MLDHFEHVEAIVERERPSRFTLSLSVQPQGRSEVALRRLFANRCAELLPAALWLIELAAAPSGVASAEVASNHFGEALDSSSDPEPRSSSRAPSGFKATSSGVNANMQGAKSAPREAASLVPDATWVSAPAARREPSRSDHGEDDGPREKLLWHARLAGLAGVFGGAGVGAQGTVGVAAAISVGVFHSQLGVSQLLPAERSVPHGGHLHLWSLELRATECALWGRRVQGGPCAGLAFLRTAAHSRDFGHDVHRTLYWGLAELGLKLSCPLTRALELGFGAAVGLPLTARPSFTVENVGPVATAARWSQEAQVGVIYVLR
jgi:hypothetical protein